MRWIILFVATVVLAMGAVPSRAHASSAIVTSDAGCVQSAASAAVNQAGLVVTFGDGRTVTFCVEFGEDSITGLELLQRSGLQLVTSNSSGLGAAVCSIDGEGCQDPGDCFCKCKGGSCEYWAYYLYDDGGWKFSPVGAGNRSVHDGDTDGWAWGGGSGDTPNGNAPACAEPTPTTTVVPPPTPRPSATPRASAPTVPLEPSATSASQIIETSTLAPTVQLAVPPPIPTAPVVPTVAVLSGVQTPRQPTSPSGTPTATSSERSDPSATPSREARAGATRVSADEGTRNLSTRAGGGGSSRLSLVTFGAVAAVLAGTASVVIWRRRGRV